MKVKVEVQSSAYKACCPILNQININHNQLLS